MVAETQSRPENIVPEHAEAETTRGSQAVMILENCACRVDAHYPGVGMSHVEFGLLNKGYV
jgi:hypothetical protein